MFMVRKLKTYKIEAKDPVSGKFSIALMIFAVRLKNVKHLLSHFMPSFPRFLFVTMHTLANEMYLKSMIAYFPT